MRKMLMIYLLLMMYCGTGFAGAEPLDQSALTTEICQAQTLANMKLGIYAIPEKVLNTYFQSIARDNPKVKDATISVQGNNKLLLTIDVTGVGMLRLTCAIKQLHYDKENALLELYIEKKELVGQSFATFFLNKMSLGFIANLYGNPIHDTDSKIKGNLIDIDLKPFSSSLFKSGIGQSVVDMIAISKATTDTGVIYLHTNCSINILASGK